MAIQTANTTKLEQLPEAARDRIEQLRLLFIERSRGHLTEIQQLLDERQTASDPRTIDADLIKLAHSLVGASGIFGFQELGDTAFKFETTLRKPGYHEADFTQVAGDLIDQLTLLG